MMTNPDLVTFIRARYAHGEISLSELPGRLARFITVRNHDAWEFDVVGFKLSFATEPPAPSTSGRATREKTFDTPGHDAARRLNA